MSTRYPGYEVVDYKFLKPTTEKTLNFIEIKEHLLKKYNEGDELTLPDTTRFLDKSVDLTGEKIALCTFQRSGNTLVRKYMELVTGVATGSDMSMVFNIDY